VQLLSDDDLNLRAMTDDELDAAWDLWFDLAQWTNEYDPPFMHGVFVNLTWADLGRPGGPAARSLRREP